MLFFINSVYIIMLYYSCCNKVNTFYCYHEVVFSIQRVITMQHSLALHRTKFLGNL